MGAWRLVADVGGTHVRLSRAGPEGRLADRVEWETSRHPAFTDALQAYLARIGGAQGCAGARIGAAGPVAGGAVRLTNGAWTIRADEVSGLLGGAPVRLFNDLEAAALAIPWLGSGDLLPLVTPRAAPAPGGARLAVNVGTGFGAAALVPAAGGWATLASEAGHMTLGATTADELALLAALGSAAPSVERALSGEGLVALYRAFAAREARPPAARTAPQVLALAPGDPAARRATAAFTVLLARVTGDLVLATAAWGGAYLFGSVILGWHARCDPGLFRAQFTAKGKMAGRMAEVPVCLVTNEAAPLIGLARQ